MKFIKNIGSGKWLNSIVVFSLTYIFFLVLILNPHNSYFSDNDSFYHVGSAHLLMEKGIVQQFPWLSFTVLSANYVDLHFIFHLILIPFILIFGDIIGSKLLIVLSIASSFTLFYHILYLKYRNYALPITLGVLFILPSDFYFRQVFIRDMAPSLFMLLLGIYTTINQKYNLLAIIMLIFVWLYGGFLLMGMFVGAYLTGQYVCHRTIDWRLLGYVCISIILGLVINPFFPSNITFLYLQLFQTGLGAQKYVGGEWKPYDTWYFTQMALLPLLIFFGGLFTKVCGPALSNLTKDQLSPDTKKSVIIEISLVLFTFGFLILQFKSKRFIEYAPVFMILTGLYLGRDFVADFTKWFVKGDWRIKEIIIPILLVASLGVITVQYSLSQLHRAYADTETTYDIKAISGAMSYIKQNSQQGDIVFTDDWDIFPLYFYFNRYNYYVVGLDPEFMVQYTNAEFKQKNELYQLYSRITNDSPTKEDLDKIKSVFKAKFVIVDFEHQVLKDSLDQQSQIFSRVYEQGEYFVYMVL